MLSFRLAVVLLLVASAVSRGEDEKVERFIGGMRRAMDDRERVVLYQLDHASTAKKLRQFAQQIGWKRADIRASDPRFPAALRRFEPWGVWMYPDYIELEFGGAFGDIGFRAFRPGLAGTGTKKLGDGVWYYAQDGRVPPR
jgi:hypothetical protein